MEELLHGYGNLMDSPLDLVQSIETQGLTAEIGGNSVWNFGLVVEDFALFTKRLPNGEQTRRLLPLDVEQRGVMDSVPNRFVGGRVLALHNASIFSSGRSGRDIG